MIRIEHLSKNFGNLSVLRDISAEIEKGEVISIIGPSGSGKSTFLRCVNLLDRPTSGKISINGVNILDRHTDVARVRQKMNMVFQAFNLFTHLTVLENLTLAPVKLLGRSRQEAERKGHDLLRLIGLGEKSMSYPDELSGGQKQRVAIARCLAMEPEIILFDEPTSALDPTMVSEVLSVIRRLAKEGLTMLNVTHEMDFARDVSTRVFYLDEGTIYEQGTPGEIFDNPCKEKTKAFIRRQQSLYQRLFSADFDLYSLNAEVESFCSRHLVPLKSRHDLTLLIEEVLQLYCASSSSFPIDITVNYSEKTGQLELLLESPPGSANPLELQGEDYALGLSIIGNLLQDRKFTHSENRNILKLYLKNP